MPISLKVRLSRYISFLIKYIWYILVNFRNITISRHLCDIHITLHLMMRATLPINGETSRYFDLTAIYQLDAMAAWRWRVHDERRGVLEHHQVRYYHTGRQAGIAYTRCYLAIFLSGHDITYYAPAATDVTTSAEASTVADKSYRVHLFYRVVVAALNTFRLFVLMIYGISFWFRYQSPTSIFPLSPSSSKAHGALVERESPRFSQAASIDVSLQLTDYASSKLSAFNSLTTLLGHIC